ncbi:hypothetical protein B0A48_16040 [Cryoendolithus antarcticus]|uniref:Uncharacterized protein n=1 Tax=Cryoendolithus antarcticus TaxID=1507870 RepID=A0A1V8SFG7_9PEZI|nr:hypothetical protein B0A48_16040 [Cryoendolithus antarcticus]
MTVSLLTLAERHIVTRQWRQGAQCLRCLHTSRPNGADKGTGGEAVDSSILPRSSLRHQRAARISQEVSALRDTPSADPAPLISSDAASTAQDQSHTAAIDAHPSSNASVQGILGQNSGPAREGPFAQPVGRLDEGREAESSEKFSSQGLGARTTDGNPTNPSVGETAVLSPQTQPSDPTAPASHTPYLRTATLSLVTTSPSHRSLRRQLLGPKALPTPIPPTTPDAAVPYIKSHLRVLQPTRPHRKAFRPRNAPHPDREALLATRQELRAEAATAREALGGGRHYFKDLPEELRGKFRENREALEATAKARDGAVRAKISGTLVEKFVKGRYDPRGLLLGGEGKAKGYGREVLNSVARGLLRNGTYLGKDAERVVSKVRSLLPALPAAGSGGGARRAQASN